MRGMILAAGRGQRMGSLTTQTPKPLLKIGDRYLIEYAIDTLVAGGIQEIVVNVAWHAQQIIDTLGNGQRYGVRFEYSYESDALETGGGIVKALPLLGTSPFVVISADVIVEHSIREMQLAPSKLAHLLLVNNPTYHKEGDFSLQGNAVLPSGRDTLTYANVGIFSPLLFAGCLPGRYPLGPLLQRAVQEGQVTGERCVGRWWNVGTPAVLQAAAETLLSEVRIF